MLEEVNVHVVEPLVSLYIITSERKHASVNISQMEVCLLIIVRL
jgi:hypothetical protein